MQGLEPAGRRQTGARVARCNDPRKGRASPSHGTPGFHQDARAFAADNRIDLLDGEFFLTILERLPEDANRRLLELATEGDWTTPTCPGCGTKMIARDSKRGLLGLPNLPEVPRNAADAGTAQKVEAAAHASRR